MLGEPGTYYQPSGKAPAAGTLLMFAAGVLTPLPLCLAYGYLIKYNPLIYINFLATIVYGWLVGQAIYRAGKFGKIRNRVLIALAGLGGGLAAVYLGWGAYICALTELNLACFSPDVIAKFMSYFYAEGSWSLSDWTPKGIFLALFWLVEAAIIAGMVFHIAYSELAHLAFCEGCDTWTETETDVVQLELTETEMLRLALEAKHFEVLTQLPRARQQSPNCLRLSLHICPTCQENCYLTIDHVEVQLNKEGKEERESSAIVSNLCVPPEVIASLREIMASPFQEPAVPAEAGEEAGADTDAGDDVDPEGDDDDVTAADNGAEELA